MPVSPEAQEVLSAFIERRRAQQILESKGLEDRTRAILQDVALKYRDSELFSLLRESFMESDPTFRARMAQMVEEVSPAA